MLLILNFWPPFNRYSCSKHNNTTPQITWNEATRLCQTVFKELPLVIFFSVSSHQTL